LACVKIVAFFGRKVIIKCAKFTLKKGAEMKSICEECANYFGCNLPYKNDISNQSDCGNFKLPLPETEVCHYCDKPNPEDVQGPTKTHMKWELHNNETGEHFHRSICFQCYHKVLSSHQGLYIKVVCKIYELLLKKQIDKRLEILKELIKNNVCGICRPDGFVGCADNTCDIWKAINSL